jgi:ABC-type antimicrobial peptide transport system permease subunit
MTEELYSPRGVQSAFIGEYVRNWFGIDTADINAKIIVDLHSQKWGTKYYEVRPMAALTRMG